uniref:ABC transmembrane type-2 domain-containing protein n=1 Tax=Scinaia undulata TaxID=1884664 RepID=A0A1G4NXQ5_9FLOR|nr:Hypothetical protein ycf38 [Scinaia undulata]SCW23460.1 Hypothetical protein ycf38 [Scinaia undulata]
MLHVNKFGVLHPNFTRRYYDQLNQKYLQEICALTKRLFIQNRRRPSLMLTGIIQPLLWLLLFSALFQNAPVQLFTSTDKYSDFMSSGMIVFTAFTSSLNAGLPLIFDREFGFFNRLLSSPLHSRYSIILSASFNIFCNNVLQVTSIIYTCSLKGTAVPNFHNIQLIIWILFLLGNSITNISLMLGFLLPGHVELLACIIIINLPLLFSSTALAPLIFMPSWLQVIASINPLSYAIETVRYAYLNQSWNCESIIMQNVWGSVTVITIFALFIGSNLICLALIWKLISNKFED